MAPIGALCLKSWGLRAGTALPGYSDCGYLHPLTFLVFVFLSHLLHMLLFNLSNTPKNKQITAYFIVFITDFLPF